MKSCVYKRQRDERQRETETKRETDRKRDRQSERETGTERDRDWERQGLRETDTETETERDRNREWDRDREIDWFLEAMKTKAKATWLSWLFKITISNHPSWIMEVQILIILSCCLLLHRTLEASLPWQWQMLKAISGSPVLTLSCLAALSDHPSHHYCFVFRLRCIIKITSPCFIGVSLCMLPLGACFVMYLCDHVLPSPRKYDSSWFTGAQINSV